MFSSQEYVADKLMVKICRDRQEIGETAADAVAAKIAALLKTQDVVNVIFAAAASQNEFLEALLTRPVDWSRVNAFHMDEYLGLPDGAPQHFGAFLKERLFAKVPFREVFYLNGNPDQPQEECRRYEGLLQAYPTDITCMGIGENTHLAFNDPHMADFHDPYLVKVVDLDVPCRQQQVNEGCFATLEEVPVDAFTLTIPALLKAQAIYCMVPGKSKAEAVYHTLTEPVTETYPSTILRTLPQAVLFLDHDSAEKVRGIPEDAF